MNSASLNSRGKGEGGRGFHIYALLVCDPVKCLFFKQLSLVWDIYIEISEFESRIEYH